MDAHLRNHHLPAPHVRFDRHIVWGLLLPLLLTLASCATSRSDASSSVFETSNPLPAKTASKEPKTPDPRPSSGTWVAGHSIEGRPLTVESLGAGPDVILLIATIHGNESAGTPLLMRAAEHCRAHPELLEGRRVVLVPVANPDGYAKSRRRNMRGVDLNRNFPSKNFRSRQGHGDTPLSEPESQALAKIFERYDPTRVVSIHQPVAVIDYDGDARDLAEAMGRVSRLPVKRIGSRPGSLGSWVGNDLGRPIITLELPEDASRLSVQDLWDLHGPAILAAITHQRQP